MFNTADLPTRSSKKTYSSSLFPSLARLLARTPSPNRFGPSNVKSQNHNKLKDYKMPLKAESTSSEDAELSREKVKSPVEPKTHSVPFVSSQQK